MTRPVHFAVEILFDTLSQPACENAVGRDAFEDIGRDSAMTDDEAEVTCPRCLKALGYKIEPVERLTETVGDPLLGRHAA